MNLQAKGGKKKRNCETQMEKKMIDEHLKLLTMRFYFT